MAAPSEKSLKDLSGKWKMASSRSRSIDTFSPLTRIESRPIRRCRWSPSDCVTSGINKELALSRALTMFQQGFNTIMRKAIAHAPVYLHISQSMEGDNTKYNIDQKTSTNIPAVNEEWITDWQMRESKDPVMGLVKAKAKWSTPSDVEDANFLAGDWLDEGSEQVEAYVESPGGGWTAHQIWGFESIKDQRVFVRRVVVKKDQQMEKVQLVYDYQE